jgi:hypothetical protein
MSLKHLEAEESQTTERRRESRWNIPFPVRIQGLRDDGSGFEEQTLTADASPSGMCVYLSSKPRQGDEVLVSAPEDAFETMAIVIHISSPGSVSNRISLRFPREIKFLRSHSAKRYVYDFNENLWVSYILEGIYYNAKNEPFGEVRGNGIRSLSDGELMFQIGDGRVYDLRGTCIGHLI